MVNPANQVSKKLQSRIPMSIPLRKLEVPEISGYHLHWMRGEVRVQQALRGGYEFVESDEVEVYSSSVANGVGSGTDLGSRVSIISGVEGGTLYLMKIKQEFFDEDQDALAATSERIAASLRGTADPMTYIPQAHMKAVNNLFTPKR